MYTALILPSSSAHYYVETENKDSWMDEKETDA